MIALLMNDESTVGSSMDDSRRGAAACAGAREAEDAQPDPAELWLGTNGVNII